MKQLKWINLLLICTIYLSACQKKDLTEVERKISNPNLFTITLNGQDVQVLRKGSLYYFYDDVMFGQETFDSLRKRYLEKQTKPRSVYNSTMSNHWTNGIVYYTLSSIFDSYPNEKQKIIDAINHWRQKTSLQFILRTNQQNYIGFERVNNENYAGASETIGRKGGYQYIKLDAADPFTVGTVIHEIGHALGLYHEQSRSDRDNSITINWGNMFSDNETQYQFRTYVQNSLPGAEIGTFDFNSIMLYGSYAGSRFNPTVDFWQWLNNPVMTKVSDGSTFDGQRDTLSAGDVNTSNFIYGPPFAKFSYTTTTITDNGFEYEFQHAFYLTFYSDITLTQPVILPTSKPVQVYIDDSGFVEGQGPWYSRTYQIINLQPGQSEYLIGTGYNKGYDDPWSTSRNWNETIAYGVVNNGYTR